MSDMHGAVDFFALNVAAEDASSIVMLVPPDRTTALAPLVLRNVRVTTSRNIRVVPPLCTITELGEQHTALEDTAVVPPPSSSASSMCSPASDALPSSSWTEVWPGGGSDEPNEPINLKEKLDSSPEGKMVIDVQFIM